MVMANVMLYTVEAQFGFFLRNFCFSLLEVTILSYFLLAGKSTDAINDTVDSIYEDVKVL